MQPLYTIEVPEPKGSSIPTHKTSLWMNFLWWFFFTLLNTIVYVLLALVNTLWRYIYNYSLAFTYNPEPAPEFTEIIKIQEPVVFVHGILGRGNNGREGIVPYWAQVYEIFEHPIIPTNLPSCNMRDRAIDLFYYIKGGQTDFGEMYNNDVGHNRYGEKHEGSYKKWNAKNPLVFFGHSAGAGTIKWLMYLMETNQIPGYNTNNDLPDDEKPSIKWFKGYITIAGANQGIPYVIQMGGPTTYTNIDKPIRENSSLYYLLSIICLYEKYIFNWFRENIFSFGLKELFNLDKLNIFQLLSRNKNNVYVPKYTLFRDFVLDQAQIDNKIINQTVTNANHDIIMVNFVNTYDYPLDDYGFYRLPYPTCNPICNIFTYLGSGRFKGEGDQKPNLLYGQEWKYEEWLESDGIASKKGQYIPFDYNQTELFDNSVYNDDKERFALEPGVIYKTNTNLDHLQTVAAYDPNINRHKFYDLIARLIISINEYRMKNNLPYIPEGPFPDNLYTQPKKNILQFEINFSFITNFLPFFN